MAMFESTLDPSSSSPFVDFGPLPSTAAFAARLQEGDGAGDHRLRRLGLEGVERRRCETLSARQLGARRQVSVDAGGTVRRAARPQSFAAAPRARPLSAGAEDALRVSDARA